MNIFANGKIVEGAFTVVNGRFADVQVTGERKQGDIIIPGCVDIHSHGRELVDFSNVDEKGLCRILKSYASVGVTSVLATTMTNPRDMVERSAEAIGKHIISQAHSLERGESRLLGIHMEGPFLGEDKKGAHDVRYLSGFDYDFTERIIEKSGRNVRIIAVDGKLPGAVQFVEKYTKMGIKVSQAHSSIDYFGAMEIFKAGASEVTHLFNAMNPLHHREPGLIGAAFDAGAYTELIGDGYHVNETVVRMWFAMNPDKIILISDSMEAAGARDGEYQIGGLKVFVKNGCATLGDGTIAGSTTNVFQCMKNAISFGVAEEKAIAAATERPAKAIGMEKKIGNITDGAYADYLVVDSDYNIKGIFINGREL